MNLKKTNRRYEMDLTTGSIFPKLVAFALPLVLSGVLQLLFNAADLVVIGKFGADHSIGAVGSTSALINLIVNVFLGFSVGGNVVAARAYGAGDFDRVRKTVKTAMSIAVVSGVILIFVGIILARPMLELMNTKDEVIELSTLYMKIYFLQMPANMVFNFGSALLRAVGDTKRPLFFLAGAGVVNVGLNLIFVICFHMDVAGVALATTISQYLSAGAVVVCMIRSKGPCHLDVKDLGVDWKIMADIFRFGLAVGFQSFIFSISNVLIQTSVNEFSAEVVDGNTAAMNIEGFVYTSMNAIAQSTLCFVSQNVGAKKVDRIPKIVRQSLAFVIGVGLALGFLAYLFGPKLLWLYNKDEEVISFGLMRLAIIATTYFLCGVMDTLGSSVRGLGYAFLPMVVSLVGSCVLRIVWIYTVFPTFHTTTCIYLSYPLSWGLTALVHAVCFLILFGKYKKNTPKET